ncbi:MAG TPA: thiamine-phosphate kinase, partial [Polyangiaceae bacterium]|nr:thiamine-phosphate kinase [Polyangiaceae bacterium]
DSVVEHVHFRRAWLTFEQLGYKATMGALSDLAAMGAAPLGVLSSLILPEHVDDEALEALARGQAEACAEVDTTVVGGNLARGAELSITTTVVGQASAALRRDGARPGDEVVVAGPLGLAAAGLRSLLSDRADEPVLQGAVAAWRRPRARIEEGMCLADVATAAIDVSDGLALDVTRLAEASGCQVVLSAEALVSPTLVEAAAALGIEPLELALSGGEDYALVATVPSGAARAGFSVIGRCEEGEGVLLEDATGRRSPVEAVGWDHFADP